MTETMNLLLVEDSPDDAAILFEMISELESSRDEESSFRFNIVHKTSIADAALYLAGYPGVNLMLLDLNLPDSVDLEGLRKLEIWVYEIPIIILSGQNDTSLAIQALRRGAQDYLLKGKTTSEMLLRSMRYSLERHKMVVMLRNLAIIDSQTGLYNRRGFQAFLETRIPVARREKLDSSLFLLEIRRPLSPSPRAEPDEGLYSKVADILRHCVRETDVVARIGENEYALFAVTMRSEGIEAILERIDRGFDELRKGGVLSIAVSRADNPYTGNASVDDLIRQARGMLSA